VSGHLLGEFEADDRYLPEFPGVRTTLDSGKV